jgi:RNA polymerase sigma-70 factor (ECF subfamily)
MRTGLAVTTGVTAHEKRVMTESDSEIVGLIRQGHLERYSDLVIRYERYVFSLVSHYVNALHVPDVAQEAFLRGFRDLAQLKDGAAFKGWIRMIAIRSSYDFLRKERSLPSTAPVSKGEFEYDARQLSEALENFEEELTRFESAALLRSIFSELGPEERMVLVMLYFEDYSVQDAAQVLGWSQANVKIRAYRARKKAQKVANMFTKEDI